MVYWFYDKKDLRTTPSTTDGIPFDTEMRYRKEGARFIMDLGTKIGLRYDTVATGVVFMHRFYMFHSYKEFDRYVTACCCLFLAGKVEETPKKCKDIIKVAKSLLSETKFAAFGTDPKEEVMTMERILLQTIKFDLQVEHPYTYLIKYAKCLKGDKQKLHKCVQMAWTFVNDSLCTTLCLQWEPEIIAIALMYLAGKLSKFEVVDWVGRQPHHLRWWDMFVEDISMELLEDICHQVLDLYTQPKVSETGDSPPLGELRPDMGDPSSLAQASPDQLTPKKEQKRSAASTPPGPAPRSESAAVAAAVASASASVPSSQPGYSYQYPGQSSVPPSSYMYAPYPPPPAPAGGPGAPPPPPTLAAAPAPSAGAQPTKFQTQYPTYGYPADKDSVAPPPPPPPPASKYPPLPPGPGGPLPPGGAPPPPPPLHPPFPPGGAGGPPSRGFYPPGGPMQPGFRPPGPGFPPGHRPF